MLITIIIFLIVCFSFIFNRKVKLYDLMLEGTKEGIKQTLKLSAPIMTITLAVEIFVNSGVIDLLNKVLVFKGVPPEIYLQLIIKPISYNSSLVVMNQIFEKYGVNHLISYLSSIIQGAFDSTIFVCALYFNEIKEHYFKKTLSSALLINLLSAFLAIILWYIFF